MKVLFIGGTGIISSACSELALKQGIDLYLLNRGRSSRPTPEGAKVIQADIRQPDSVTTALGDLTFDSVVEWVAYTPDQVQNDLELFRQRTRQYIFISSASAYQTPPAFLPVQESTPLDNPFWGYSRDKAACEALLEQAGRQEGFPSPSCAHRTPTTAPCCPFTAATPAWRACAQAKQWSCTATGPLCGRSPTSAISPSVWWVCWATRMP
jgi:nucleoside-diphosphate-sugar epimerase